MNSFAYGPANTHQRHARQLPRRAAILCLFHPDCNRWSRILTGSAKRTKRGGHLICSGRGLPAWYARLLVTASGESHPALKQNSSSPYCMRESGRLQPLCGKFLEKGGDGAIRGWRPACPVSRKRVTRRKGVPIPNLNLDETRGKHASSIFGVSIREAARKVSARSLAAAARRKIMQPRQGAAPCNYGEAQVRATMNTLRRLCATMPPTHVPHPPISFAVQLLHRNGAYLLVFSKGKTLDRAQDVPAPRGSRCQGFACESPSSAGFMHVADIATLRPQACSTLLRLCKMRSA